MKGLFLTSWRIEIHTPSPQHRAMKEISHSLCKWSHNKWSVLPYSNHLQTSERFSDTLSKHTPFLSAHSLLEIQTFLKLNRMNYLPQMTGLWASSSADELSLAWSVSKLCLLSLKLSHFFLPLTKLSYLTVKKNNYWIHSWYSKKYMKYIFFWCHLWVGLKVMQYSRSSSVSQKQLKEKGFQESDLKMQLNCKEHRESEYSTPQLFNFQPSHIWLLTLYNIVVYNESFLDQFISQL